MAWLKKVNINMPIDIYSKRLGINRCYVIKADGCIMVDTGPPKSDRAIENWLRTIPINPQEIQLIILTHGHADHVGSAMRVKNFTGARIALHEYDKDMFENGVIVKAFSGYDLGTRGACCLQAVDAPIPFPQR